MPPTDETDFGLWPTPLAQEAKHGTVTDWEINTDHKATKGSLRVAAAKSMWPTPTARDYKGGRTLETLAKVGRNEKNSLPDAINAQMGKTGPLNPQFVEWLMGYPSGWTDLEV
jgi:hypothetical protein